LARQGRKIFLKEEKMKRFLTVILFLFISVSFLNAQWARTYGGSEGEWGNCIRQTTDGGYIIAGYTDSFGAYADFWVLKTNADGLVEWEKRYGGIQGEEVAYSVQQTADGGYIVAGYANSFGGYYDLWVLKLFPDGSIEWQKLYTAVESDSIDIPCIQQTADGGYIVTVDNFDTTGYQFWIMKLSSDGTIEWQKGYGKTGWDGVQSIRQTTDGGYIVAGYTSPVWGMPDAWILKLSSNGSIEWQKTYGTKSGRDNAYSIQQTNDGGYIVAGCTDSFGAGYEDVWVLKLFPDGSIEWQRSYGGIGPDTAYSIQQTSDDGYIVGGETCSFGVDSYEDFWVLKLSSTGDVEWQKNYGTNWDDYGRCIQQTTDGGYVVVGYAYSFGAGNGDIMVLKLFPNGGIHSSCGFIKNTDAVVAETSVIPASTSIIPQNISVTAKNTTASPQNTTATVNLLCECPKYTLTISATSGGTIDPAPDTYTYYEGKEITIAATADENYRFKEWTGDVPSGHENDNPITITMNSDKSITANFIRQYTLTITTGSGGTTDPVPGTYTYDSGTQVSIVAVPESGYRFSGWSGDASGTTNPITVTMDGNKSISASFIKQYTLTIAAGTGGTTDPIPGTYTYDTGTQVSVKATADTNYRFDKWTGDATGTTNPITITMDGNKSITANFIHQYKLTIATGSGGTTDPAPGTYTYDSSVQVSVKAMPNSGYQFSGWSGSVTGTTNPITITMDADKSITASFSVIPKPEEKKKGGCFIATAAYGSALDPHVQVLRDFRDKYLMTNKIGRKFVDFYYKHSPPIANFISRHKVLKPCVRILLLPLITVSYLTV
jgi:uncharacterized repeat protein (TIGR02543 family)/uncharacterized delta-60 repeat protein